MMYRPFLFSVLISLVVFSCSCSKAAHEEMPAPVSKPRKAKPAAKAVKEARNLADFTTYRPAENEIVYIVDPDSGPGTDYTSLNEFNDREKRDLVSAKQIVTALCRSSKGSADKAAQMEGWTTSEDYYVQIIAHEDHRASAKWDESKYRIEEYTTINSECLDVETPHLLVDGIQMKIYGTGKSNDIIDPEKGQKYTIKNCYLWMDLDIPTGYGIDLKSPADISNCIFRGTGAAAVFVFPGANVNLYNNTFVGWKNAIKNEGTVRAINNLAIGASRKAFRIKEDGVFTDDSDYNGAEHPGQALVKAPRSSQQAPWHLNQLSLTDVFTDPENDDFRLKSGLELTKAGIGPAANDIIPTTDIDGEKRSGKHTSLGATNSQ